MDSIVEFAKSKGYDVTAEDVAAHAKAQAGRELSDDELDAVSGGQGQPATTAVNTDTAVSMIINGVVVTLTSSIVGVY